MTEPDIDLQSHPSAAVWTADLPSLSADQISELRSHFPNLRVDKQDEFNFRVGLIFRAYYHSEFLLRSQPKNQKPSTKTAKELGAILEASDTLIKLIDRASHEAKALLDDQPRPAATGSDARQSNTVRSFRNGLAAFSDRVAFVERDAAGRVKRGRSERGQRHLVATLYTLREDLNGTPSKRAYRAGDPSADGRGAETGPLLDLARAVARMVNDALPSALRRSAPPSLSKLVREEIEQRKRHMAQ